MAKRKYAGTTIKGAEPRVRFDAQRRPDGSFARERAMGGFLTDADGNEMPVVVNRLIFQCQHDDDKPDWQGVAALNGFRGGSVQIRCDECRLTIRVRRQDMAGLWVIASHHEDAVRFQGLIGVGMHDGRPGAAYAVVQLRAVERLVAVWRQRLADEEDAGADEPDHV